MKLRSGREVPIEGPVGIDPDANAIFYGYDGAITRSRDGSGVRVPEYWACGTSVSHAYPTQAERDEVATVIIARWLRWACPGLTRRPLDEQWDSFRRRMHAAADVQAREKMYAELSRERDHMSARALELRQRAETAEAEVALLREELIHWREGGND